MDKLLSFQVAHVLQLQECLSREKCVIDGSDTGCGKTWCAIVLCKLLNLTPFIICPKSVISNWQSVANQIGVRILGIANYEMLKNGNYYTENCEKVNCPYFDIIKDETKKNNSTNYDFKLPHDTLVIFDEAHRCKNHRTSTAHLLLSAKKANIKILLLSATLTDKIETFACFGTMFGLYDGHKKFQGWIRKEKIINKIKYSKPPGSLLDEDGKTLDIINKTMYPRFGSRMKIKELGDLFPKNTISADAYFMPNYKEVDKLYDEINTAMQELKQKELRSDALGRIIRARQRIELLKVPTFVEIAEDALENNYAVVIFVNYKETMYQLCHHLNTACIIYGEQTLEEREENIKQFQENKSNIIIANIQAGGVGISLHDLNGKQRMSIISPTWSGIQMQQAFGRIHRAGSKSPAIQKIVYCAKTYEEDICKLIKNKLRTISAINDGDLVGPQIDVVKYNEHLEDLYKDKNNL